MILKGIGSGNNAHWYTTDGEPRHDADLRQARKENLLPSVTSVLQVWPKFGLDNWKLETAILASITLPRAPGEDHDAFAVRVVKDMEGPKNEAAERGKLIHAIIESININEGKLPDGFSVPKEVEKQIEAYLKFYDKEIIRVLSTETVAINYEYGYAGQYDMLAETRSYGVAIMDVKGQSFKKGEATYYDTWGFQLSAYGKTLNKYLGGIIESRVSIAVNTNLNMTPNCKLIAPGKWNTEEERDWGSFLACLNLWRHSKNYFYDATSKQGSKLQASRPPRKA